MKLAVHFGAGNIGRGFIAPVLFENDYKVIFVDVNKELVNLINSEKSYRVTSINSNSSDINIVSNITAIDLASTDQLKTALLDADLISTSVGSKFVKDIYQKVSELDNDRNQIFVAFENMYRASTTSSNQVKKLNPNLEVIDVVVDKIVPPQITDSLSVTVEKYGSIILDEASKGRPLNQSEIVSYKNYENEFYKKLWLLNGLHLKLAYFGLSQNLKFIHEVLQNEEGKIFASESINALAKAYKIYSKTDENLETFSKIIHNRFSLPELQDEVRRVARNPEIKFSLNERFEHPLRYLISEDEEITTFKEVLDIIYSNNFDEVEGFSKFKLTELTNDKKSFYNKFWKIDTNIQKYTKRLGE